MTSISRLPGRRDHRDPARALDGGRHLHLVPAAGAGDAAAADLAPLGDVTAQLGDVLVVDLRDVLLAEEAVAAPDLPLGAAGPSPLLLLGGLVSGHQKGMSSSAVLGKSALSCCAAPA